MARTRDCIMAELRQCQTKLLAAKKRRDNTKANYYRTRIHELQREYESV